MLNKEVKHLKFGKGKVVEIIDRVGLPNLLKVEFENGEIKIFQECGLENPKWFELESEEVVENE